MTNTTALLAGIIVGFVITDVLDRIRWRRLVRKYSTGPVNKTPPTTAELKPRPAPPQRRNPSG